MKTLTLCLLFFSSLFADPFADISDEVIAAIRQGNSAAIAAHFSDKVDMKILDQEDVYSKAQAEAVLKDFFGKNKAKNFTPSHSANKTANRFVVGVLESSGGKFRVSFFIKKNGEIYQISQFRIEKETE